MPEEQATTPQSFEIKIAVIGPVSAGKSTLINGLLVGKYSEVSMQRTTAGVNFFRLKPTTKESNASVITPDVVPSDSQTASSSSQEDEILEEISRNNKRLREEDEEKLVRKAYFDIDGVKICECRKDTKLVIVDVPGINEAGSSRKYRDFVQKEWKEFDCVILVLDGRHGVNTEEQVQMLEFVKANLKERNVPVLILFNKVDELGFDEKDAILKEAREKVSTLFDIPPNLDLAKMIMDNEFGDDLKSLKNDKGFYMPIFLPVSARNGYIYRLASKASAARFKKLEMHLVEELGREQIGLRQWNKLSKSKKYKAAFEAISDPDVRNEGLESSNHTALELILSFCVGKQSQKALILAQIERDISQLPADKNLVSNIGIVWAKMKATGGKGSSNFPISLQNAFWEKLDQMERTSLTLEKAPIVLDVLIQYQSLMSSAPSQSGEEERTMQKAVRFLNKMMYAVLQNWKVGGEVNIFKISRILSVANNSYFNDNFGTLRTVLEIERQRMIGSRHFNYIFEFSDRTGMWNSTCNSYKDYPASSEKHDGHAFWMFCQWMERLENARDEI